MTRRLRMGRLPSGLRLLTETDPQASTVAAGFFIASGPAMTGPKVRGQPTS
ncbi:hypothetical protein [Deinococcus radiophilus]|uniref:hypothetical protein n=1 Tax=Deinococcus radiophilus TaxID=32062 RepID=UPI003606D233